MARGLLDGAQHIRSRREAAAALVVIGVHRFFSGLVFVMVLLLFTDEGYLRGGFGALGETLDRLSSSVAWSPPSSPLASSAGSAARHGSCSPSCSPAS